MKIIAFGASTSRNSINKQLAVYAAAQFPEAQTEILDLNDYDMPLFSVDREAAHGYPQVAHALLEAIGSADLLIISMAEHNGNYTAAFKNCLDWCSRIEPNVFQEKPMFLLSTSPGGYGGKNSLQAAITRFPRHAARILETFSLPSFVANFDVHTGITDTDLRDEFQEKVSAVRQQLNLEN